MEDQAELAKKMDGAEHIDTECDIANVQVGYEFDHEWVLPESGSGYWEATTKMVGAVIVYGDMRFYLSRDDMIRVNGLDWVQRQELWQAETNGNEYAPEGRPGVAYFYG